MKTFLVKCLGAKGFDKIVQAESVTVMADGILTFYAEDGSICCRINRWIYIEEVDNSAGTVLAPNETVEGFLQANEHLTELDDQDEEN